MQHLAELVAFTVCWMNVNSSGIYWVWPGYLVRYCPSGPQCVALWLWSSMIGIGRMCLSTFLFPVWQGLCKGLFIHSVTHTVNPVPESVEIVLTRVTIIFICEMHVQYHWIKTRRDSGHDLMSHLILQTRKQAQINLDLLRAHRQ